MGARRHPEPMTVEEFYRIPDDNSLQELVAGFVVSDPLPGFLHGRVAATVGSLLHAHVEGHSLGAALLRAGFVLSRSPDTLRVPDLSFIIEERAREADRYAAIEGAPDLAVEILSPTDSADRIREKVAEYLGAGARLVWVVDPEAETVTVHRPQSGPLTLAGEDVLDAGDVIPGFRIPVGEIFEK